MRFPAYGNALWQRRLIGERPRVAYLMVGDWWKVPKALAGAVATLPRLAVKTARWDQADAERLDWRLVVDMTVFAIDVRGPDERAEAVDGWDPWLWLLADVQRYARDVLLFTPMVHFHDPPGMFAPERTLECYAWLNRTYDAEARAWNWPPWWPHGEAIDTRSREAMAA